MKNIFMGDLYCHVRRTGFIGQYNNFSATKAAFEKNYVRKAKEEDFSFLGVTFTQDNESWFRSMVEELADKYGGHDRFLLITNEEVQDDWGHIVSMGNTALLRIAQHGIEDILAEKSDGILIAAHPQGYWSRELFLEYEKNGYFFDCIELGPWGGYNMKFIVDYCLERLRRDGFSISGSSDIHCQPGMLNTLGRTFVLADNLTKRDVIGAIKQGNCLGSFFEYLMGTQVVNP